MIRDRTETASGKGSPRRTIAGAWCGAGLSRPTERVDMPSERDTGPNPATLARYSMKSCRNFSAAAKAPAPTSTQGLCQYVKAPALMATTSATTISTNVRRETSGPGGFGARGFCGGMSYRRERPLEVACHRPPVVRIRGSSVKRVWQRHRVSPMSALSASQPADQFPAFLTRPPTPGQRPDRASGPAPQAGRKGDPHDRRCAHHSRDLRHQSRGRDHRGRQTGSSPARTAVHFSQKRDRTS